MGLAFLEQAANHAQAIRRGRGEAQLVAFLGEAVASDDELGRRAQCIAVAVDPGRSRADLFIGHRIVGIVAL